MNALQDPLFEKIMIMKVILHPEEFELVFAMLREPVQDRPT